MKLVGAASVPDQFRPVVAVHRWEESGILLGHDDGTVTAVNSNALQWLWLNPGRNITCMATFDQSIFIGFDDKSNALYSFNTGLKVGGSLLSFQVNRATVLEHFIVCWSTHGTMVTLLHRFNLEPFCEILADSFVLNVFHASGRIHVVCTSDIYWLRPVTTTDYTLDLLVHLSEDMVVDSIPFQHKICLVMPQAWNLVSIGKSGDLEYEFEINAPLGTLLKRAHLLADGIAVECSNGKMVVMRNNNIQMLECPFEKEYTTFSTGTSLFIDSHLNARILYNDRNEFTWKDFPLPLSFSETKYLIGEQDPELTAVHDDMRGFSNGSVQNVVVFTSPVVKIDREHAYTRHEVVSLPLKSINLIRQNDRALSDSRVSVKINVVEGDVFKYPFLGVQSNDDSFVCLQRFKREPPYSPHIAVYLVNGGLADFESILGKMDQASVDILEDLAVLSRESGDSGMLDVIVQFLSKVWSSSRVESLLRSGNARSLKVLASVSGYIDVDEGALVNAVKSRLSSKSLAICDAILWIYALHVQPFTEMPLPFTCLEQAPWKSVQRFAASQLEYDSDQFLKNIDTGLRSGSGSVPSSAANLLLASLDSGVAFPKNEAQLVEIVLMAIPAVKSRVSGAKEVLLKLLTAHKLMYHKGRQLFLVPTPSNRGRCGLVFDIKNESDSQFRLKMPEKSSVYSMNFAGDGHSVIGVGPGMKVVWKLSRSFSLFGSKEVEDVDAVEFQ